MGIHLKGERQAGIYSYILWIGTALFAGVFVLSFAVQVVKTSYHYVQGRDDPIADDTQIAHASVLSGSTKTTSDTAGQSASAVEFVIGKTLSPSSEIETIEESRQITITLVGDIMLDRNVEESVYENGDGDFSFIFEYSGFLKESDIVFGNLEGSVSDKGEDLQNLYSFRMDPIVVPELKDAGFDILSVANNHSGDWGRDAFNDTISRLAEHDILFTGGGFDKRKAEEVTIIEKEGATVGFLAFSDIGPKLFEAGENFPGILYADDPYFNDIIQRASGSVDILIVSLHFGDEYQAQVSDRQRELAYVAIDAGADVVAGHHTHVIQDVDGYKDGIIAYGLGNFIFDQNFSEETMEGLVLDVIVDDGEIVGYKKKRVILNEFFQPKLKF